MTKQCYQIRNPIKLLFHLRNEAYNFFLHHVMKGENRTDNFINARSALMISWTSEYSQVLHISQDCQYSMVIVQPKARLIMNNGDMKLKVCCMRDRTKVRS
jgi:hypothetical protein